MTVLRLDDPLKTPMSDIAYLNNERAGHAIRALGDRLRLVRLRRRVTSKALAARVGVSRSTIYRLEAGDAAVAVGIYAAVLEALGFHEDLGRLAADDVEGRGLQDAALPRRGLSGVPVTRPRSEVVAARVVVEDRSGSDRGIL
jgi:transcriptional regulator with XRE-family HTH domain